VQAPRIPGYSKAQSGVDSRRAQDVYVGRQSLDGTRHKEASRDYGLTIVSALTTRNGYFGTSSWTLHFDSGPTALWWIPTCSTPIDQRDYGTAHTTPIRRTQCAGYTEDHLGSTSALWSRSYCK
jgi:hypothetical protein